jgi:hypothetical protein
VREDERIRGILRDAVSAMVGEEIVAIGWFHRPGDVGDSWRKGPSLLRRVFAPRDNHPGARLGNRNVIVLTPRASSRLLAVRARRWSERAGSSSPGRAQRSDSPKARAQRAL